MRAGREFKLNVDQEMVLAEVAKWFLPQQGKKSYSGGGELIEGLSEHS